MVLQTIALPLGDRAFGGKELSVFSHRFQSKEQTARPWLAFA
jgi:hypothetical protein